MDSTIRRPSPTLESAMFPPTAAWFRCRAENGAVLRRRQLHRCRFDSFHAIAYAESSDLDELDRLQRDRTTPSFPPDRHFHRSSHAGTMLTVPATAPVVGATQAWFAGRVYAPNAIVNSTAPASASFSMATIRVTPPRATAKDLSSYRNVGQVFLSSGGVVLANLDSLMGSRATPARLSYSCFHMDRCLRRVPHLWYRRCPPRYPQNTTPRHG